MKAQYRNRYHMRVEGSACPVQDIEGVILSASNMPGPGGHLEALDRQYMFLRGLVCVMVRELSPESQRKIAEYLGYELIG